MRFKESVTPPGGFQNVKRDILLHVHVDDLLCTSLRDDLMWFKEQLLKEYELETKLMGDDDDMEKKMCVRENLVNALTILANMQLEG